MNVMCLLPFMVQHYEEPTPICREAADNIAEVSTASAIVISLYHTLSTSLVHL